MNGSGPGGLEFESPLEDAGAGGGGFGLRDVSGALQGDGEGGVGQGVVGGEGGEGEGSGDGLLEATGVGQGADEAVVGFDVVFVRGERGAEDLSRLDGEAGFKQIEAALGE